MSAGEARSAASTRIFSASCVEVGQVVAYTGAKTRLPKERDWLTVSRIDREGIQGYRVHPEDWERDVEFVIVNRQIEDIGVIVR